MADKRLIDANSLAALLIARRRDEPSAEAYDAYGQVMWDITQAETIDAVEVVRCRECRNSQKIMTSADQVYCLVWKNNPRTDGYCYLGAKMDATDNNVGHKDGGEPDGNPH